LASVHPNTSQESLKDSIWDAITAGSKKEVNLSAKSVDTLFARGAPNHPTKKYVALTIGFTTKISKAAIFVDSKKDQERPVATVL
jgi:hypothetical protein